MTTVPLADAVLLEHAGQAVYDAECALHAAHQTRVDAWIVAAADRLHEALLRLTAAERAVAGPDASEVAGGAAPGRHR